MIMWTDMIDERINADKIRTVNSLGFPNSFPKSPGFPKRFPIELLKELTGIPANRITKYFGKRFLLSFFVYFFMDIPLKRSERI